MDWIKNLLVMGVMAYAVIVAGVYIFQRNLQYFPDKKQVSPAAAGLTGIEELTLETTDGETLVAWHAPAEKDRPTIVYFHGNGGALWYRADRVQMFSEAGYGVFLLSYRGYGGSTGTPSEAGLMRDGAAAIDHLKRQGVPLERMVFYGESLGCAVAVQLAAEHTPGAVILEAPFTSAIDIGAKVYWWLPVRWLMKDRFESITFIKRLTAPLLILHGERDEVVPLESAKALYAAAAEPKTLLIVKDGGHHMEIAGKLWRQIETFLHTAL